MAADDFSIVFASLSLTYPELPHFVGPVIPTLYANITRRYTFETLRHDRDTADLQQEAHRFVRLTRSSVILEERVSGGFIPTSVVLSGITREIQEYFRIPVFWNPYLVLRAHVPVPDHGDDAVAFLRTRITSIKNDQIDALGGSVSGLTLMVETTDGQVGQERRARVELGPYLQDRSQIQVEMGLYELRPIEPPETLRQFIIDAHGYFIGQVTHFVEGIIS